MRTTADASEPGAGSPPLVPEARRGPVERFPRSGLSRALTTAGLLVLATVLPLLRARHAPWQAMFAEDGSIYAQQAIREGPIHALFQGYAGYLQLPPRLLALGTPFVPTIELVHYFAVVGAVTGALLAWFVYVASSSWVSSRVVRLVLAASLVLADVVGWEVSGNATNTIWLFLGALPVALLCGRTRPRIVVSCAVVVFLAATSTALAVLFVPLALGVAVVRRRASTWIVTAAYASGVVIQLAVVLVSTDTSKEAFPNAVRDLVPMLGVRVSSAFVFGADMSSAGSLMWTSGGWLLTGVSAAVLVGVLTVLLFRSARRDQVAALSMVVFAVLVYVVPSWGRGTTMIMWFGGPSLTAGTTRFSVVPIFLLTFAVAILVAPVGIVADRPWRRAARVLFVAHAVLIATSGFVIANPSYLGLSWHDQVVRARTECASRAPTDLVTLPTMSINSFSVTLPCADIER